MKARSNRATSRVFKVCDNLDELGPECPEERSWQWPMLLMRSRVSESRVRVVLVCIDIHTHTHTPRLKMDRLTLWLKIISTIQTNLGSSSDGV